MWSRYGGAHCDPSCWGGRGRRIWKQEDLEFKVNPGKERETLSQKQKQKGWRCRVLA
jgi:hypothetical protein